jgi:hypothetical protein
MLVLVPFIFHLSSFIIPYCTESIPLHHSSNPPPTQQCLFCVSASDHTPSHTPQMSWSLETSYWLLLQYSLTMSYHANINMDIDVVYVVSVSLLRWLYEVYPLVLAEGIEQEGGCDCDSDFNGSAIWSAPKQLRMLDLALFVMSSVERVLKPVYPLVLAEGIEHDGHCCFAFRVSLGYISGPNNASTCCLAAQASAERLL